MSKHMESNEKMMVKVDVMDLTEKILQKGSACKSKEEIKAYMDYYEFVRGYLLNLYKEQTGFDPNDVTGLFQHCGALSVPSDEEEDSDYLKTR